MPDFAGKLNDLMADKGLSLSALSRMSGVPVQTVWNYTHGVSRPSWLHVQALARALSVGCDGLADDDLPPPPPPVEVRPPGRPPKASTPASSKPRPAARPKPTAKPRTAKPVPKARRKGEDA